LLIILYSITQQRLGSCGALGPAALRAVELEHRAETDNVMPQGRMNKAVQLGSTSERRACYLSCCADKCKIK